MSAQDPHQLNGMHSLSNYTLRDEICDYWSFRAATFDLQVGHEIFSEEEQTAWHNLIKNHMGDAQDRKALDMACGTGVISHLLDDLGFQTTGIDWSDEMLNRAKTKAAKRARDIRFIKGDAENTGEPEASYDVIITRHLVWTLVDPVATFRHWFELLKPGGRLLIIDGDFVNKTTLDKVLRWIQQFTSSSLDIPPPEQVERHKNILRQVYFNQGAKADLVIELLENAGFENSALQTNMRAINNAQSKNLGIISSLTRKNMHRYAISVQKPMG